MATKALVTGGCGFIGSHLVEALLGRGYEVMVMDNLSTGKAENLVAAASAAGAKAQLKINQIKITSRHVDEDAICEMAGKAEYVFHLAALPSVPKSVQDPLGSYESGIDLTMKMLYHSSRAGVKRFIYASSSSVYGGRPDTREDAGPAPISPYAATKLAGEGLCRAFAKCYEIDAVSMRFFNVYGPRQDAASQYSGVIARFCQAFTGDEQIEVHGTGKQTRDFTYVSDVVDALIAAAEFEDRHDGDVFNVGSGQRTSVLDLVSALSEITGIKKEPIFGPQRPGDVMDTLADISKLVYVLGSPKVSLSEGLKKTMDWYKGETA